MVARCRELSLVPNEQIRLLYRGIEISDGIPLAEHVSSCAELDLHFLVLAENTGIELLQCDGVPCPKVLAECLQECADGLRQAEPLLTESGCGGAYFLRGKEDEQTLAVFKPKDEEAGAPQNPRGFWGHENSRCYLPAVASAQRAVREVAAYLLDQSSGGHAQVPMTTMARCRHQSFVPAKINGEPSVVWKLGAFQAFVENAETSENFGYSVHLVEDVHRIGILDVRMVNFDRNHGNLLVQSAETDSGKSRRLVPIDHGCSLPDRLGFSLQNVVWASWPQSKKPFGRAELEYIAQLDGQADAKMLAKTLGLERSCLRLLEMTTLWLQLAAAAGCTLYQIAAALFRSDEDRPSVIEGIIASCVASAAAGVQGPSLSRSVTHCPSRKSVELGTGGIFGKVQWTAALEETFRRHCEGHFKQLLRSEAHR